MDRKFLYLLTVLPFYLLTLIPITVSAANVVFPYEGGTTSDGIVVTKPVLKKFQLIKENELFQVDSNSSNPSIKFSVTVPDGQQAVLRYKFFFNISSTIAGGGVDNGSKVTFNVKVDKKPQKKHTDGTSICYQADEVIIPQGPHDISLEVRFEGRDCKYAGSIDSLSIHIHHFGIKELASEPLCGETGENHYKCDVCGKDSVEVVMAKQNDHHWIEYPSQKSSCMSNVGNVKKCEYCPKTEISHNGTLKEHDFDGNGQCRVCGLRMPKSNADGSVYYINDAGEMRILSEMVSLGRVSGNIGVDIKSDLVFTPNLPMMPLGTADHPFQGVLNGNGHRISGVINYFKGADCLGFVGVAKGALQSHAVIANLIFDGGNSMSGATCVGGIVGYAINCDILNCASFGTLEGSNYVGGIVGYADLHVGIYHCASASLIRTAGNWNPMACGMSNGHLLNSYGASTNSLGGSLDPLATTMLRHCFSTHGRANGLTTLSSDIFKSYNMVELLKEQSETPYFVMSETDHYPIPVVNSTVTAKANRAFEAPKLVSLRRAATLRAADDEGSEKDNEIEVIRGYFDENAPTQYFHTIEDVMREDAVQNPDINCLYVVTRSVPKGSKLYEPVSGGDLLGFESYVFPEDSSYIKMKEYHLVSANQVKAVAEAVNYRSGANERIDIYDIDNDAYSLKSRISFVNDYDIVYEENYNGVMKPLWSIETQFDDSGRAISTNGFSHNHLTGETRLEYSCTYDSDGNGAGTANDDYMEYLDSQTNTFHIIYKYTDVNPGEPVLRDHYILRASDYTLLETRTEDISGNDPQLIDGLYFIYDDEGLLTQSVAFATDENSSDVLPYLYYEYVGDWTNNPYITTAIQIPTVKQPSLKDRMDLNVYDMQGRVIRRATDMQNPFSGLPRGLYVYQGKKYIKK